ncbi:MAG: hypothetical protein ACTSWN_05990 [Promethearchaeota archaeon]
MEIVEPDLHPMYYNTHTFAHPPNQLVLESGKLLGPVTIAYETFGNLDDDKKMPCLFFMR